MKYSDYIFDFERLDVYQKGLTFANEVFSLTSNFDGKFQWSLGEQFRRSSLSICNNIAEGSRKSAKSKKQFYEYSFDSARECIPMISIALKQRQITKNTADDLRSQTVEIGNMLYRLIESIKTD